MNPVTVAICARGHRRGEAQLEVPRVGDDIDAVDIGHRSSVAKIVAPRRKQLDAIHRGGIASCCRVTPQVDGVCAAYHVTIHLGRIEIADPVSPASANDGIRAGAATQAVVTRAAVDEVVAIATKNEVVPTEPIERLAALDRSQRVIAFRAIALRQVGSQISRLDHQELAGLSELDRLWRARRVIDLECAIRHESAIQLLTERKIKRAIMLAGHQPHTVERAVETGRQQHRVQMRQRCALTLPAQAYQESPPGLLQEAGIGEFAQREEEGLRVRVVLQQARRQLVGRDAGVDAGETGNQRRPRHRRRDRAAIHADEHHCVRRFIE